MEGSVITSYSIHYTKLYEDKNVSQIELDIYGDSSALKNNGAQSLIYSILEQLQSLQEIHDYNSSTNDSSHGNLPLHAHKYKVVPVA